MPAYNSVNDKPAILSPLLDSTVKRRWAGDELGIFPLIRKVVNAGFYGVGMGFFVAVIILVVSDDS